MAASAASSNGGAAAAEAHQPALRGRPSKFTRRPGAVMRSRSAPAAATSGTTAVYGGGHRAAAAAGLPVMVGLLECLARRPLLHGAANRSGAAAGGAGVCRALGGLRDDAGEALAALPAVGGG
eukprot:CAMPEP_0179140502 /NCGR_PEP_ID=MMETSP0796-20121207/67282_1 /TAXON_ID=73915 /ORGANISM="Pyrodinium bahamense, Strain pbaha01" /LENGTH=122 /DNA_ID=CAMNT_0020840053 /DNA_START=79 /DNA_END=445 /DNA_ORIENTATION=+